MTKTNKPQVAPKPPRGYEIDAKPGDIGMFRAGWKARTALKHAREKGKP